MSGSRLPLEQTPVRAIVQPGPGRCWAVADGHKLTSVSVLVWVRDACLCPISPGVGTGHPEPERLLFPTPAEAFLQPEPEPGATDIFWTFLGQ